MFDWKRWIDETDMLLRPSIPAVSEYEDIDLLPLPSEFDIFGQPDDTSEIEGYEPVPDELEALPDPSTFAVFNDISDNDSSEVSLGGQTAVSESGKVVPARTGAIYVSYFKDQKTGTWSTKTQSAPDIADADFDLTSDENDEEVRMTLRPKGDPFISLAKCTVVQSSAVMTWAGYQGSPLCLDTCIVKDAHYCSTKYVGPLLRKLGEWMDSKNVAMSVIYTRPQGADELIIRSQAGWKFEPTHQLRITVVRDIFPDNPGFNTHFSFTCSARGILRLAAQEDKKSLGALNVGLKNTLIILTHALLKKQLKQYQADASVDLYADNRYAGAFDDSDGSEVWSSWHVDRESKTLQVSRIITSKPMGGNSYLLLEMLRCCVAFMMMNAPMCREIVIRHPPGELYHAALALADDPHLGWALQVRKEAVSDWKTYVRWHPRWDGKAVWAEKQFYCVPGEF